MRGNQPPCIVEADANKAVAHHDALVKGRVLSVNLGYDKIFVFGFKALEGTRQSFFVNRKVLKLARYVHAQLHQNGVFVVCYQAVINVLIVGAPEVQHVLNQCTGFAWKLRVHSLPQSHIARIDIVVHHAVVTNDVQVLASILFNKVTVKLACCHTNCKRAYHESV